jgi:hypothetical protein
LVSVPVAQPVGDYWAEEGAALLNLTDRAQQIIDRGLLD